MPDSQTDLGLCFCGMCTIATEPIADYGSVLMVHIYIEKALSRVRISSDV